MWFRKVQSNKKYLRLDLDRANRIIIAQNGVIKAQDELIEILDDRLRELRIEVKQGANNTETLRTYVLDSTGPKLPGTVYPDLTGDGVILDIDGMGRCHVITVNRMNLFRSSVEKIGGGTWGS